MSETPTKTVDPVTIKKYANRRLYNTGTSTYVTLEDLAAMVKNGEDFVVYDAKEGDDITRSVLTQIIFEQESKAGQNLLPIAFLRQLIRFYGDSMQMLVPRYLEVSIESLTREQEKFRQQISQAFGVGPFGALEDLAVMVKSGEDFIVYDAKSGEDITRSVLTQIIFEQENKQGQNLLPITFLRQLIRFYGDSMQMLVPRYLEVSIESLTREQEKFRNQMAQAFGVGAFTSLEDQVRRNMEMFERTFAMFAPFARRESGAAETPVEPEKTPQKTGDIDDLKRQLEDMQRKVDRLSKD